MSHISARRVGPMALVCALALAPVAIHSYGGVKREDCDRPEQLASPADWRALPEPRRERLRLLLGAFAAREGSVPGDFGDPDLRFSVVRSWEPKRLYYRPDYEIVPGPDPDGRALEWIETDAHSLPIHVPSYPEAAGIEAAYVLVYDGDPMARPVFDQIVRAPEMMLRGASPTTLYFAWTERQSGSDTARRRVRAWLTDAWHHHRTVCETI